MSSQIITKLRTKEDLDLIQVELELLKKSLYQKDANYNDVLKNDIRSWVAEIISDESKETGIEKYLNDSEEFLKSVVVLSASISFEPSDVFIDRFSEYVKTNVSKQTVVDFLFNPQLIGGVQLSFKGKYIDLSIRKKITQEFESTTLKS